MIIIKAIGKACGIDITKINGVFDISQSAARVLPQLNFDVTGKVPRPLTTHRMWASMADRPLTGAEAMLIQGFSPHSKVRGGAGRGKRCSSDSDTARIQQWGKEARSKRAIIKNRFQILF